MSRKERQESRILTTKLEIVIHEAIAPYLPEGRDSALLGLEVLEALSNVQSRLILDLREEQLTDD